MNVSNYATKADIKNFTHVETSNFALKTNLANLKTEVDKIDTDKLKTVPVDLSKLSNVVKNEVIKKAEYNKLVAKVRNIDTSNFVIKTNYNTKITELENRIPDISNLVTKNAWRTIENKIPDISNLATKAALTIVENKIPNTNSLVRKSDYNKKIIGVENAIKELQAYDLSYYSGKKYVDEGDGEQNYLVFQPMRQYLN